MRVCASWQTKRARFSARMFAFVPASFFHSSYLLLLFAYIVIALDTLLLRAHARRANVYQDKK